MGDKQIKRIIQNFKDLIKLSLESDKKENHLTPDQTRAILNEVKFWEMILRYEVSKKRVRGKFNSVYPPMHWEVIKPMGLLEENKKRNYETLKEGDYDFVMASKGD